MIIKEPTMTSILSKDFHYHNASSHSNPDAFRERMKEYAKSRERSETPQPAYNPYANDKRDWK